MDTALRGKVAWLIAVRAVISTVLLGSATIARVTQSGSFAVDPFFFLIGITYALTIGAAISLRYVERRRWLVDLQLAGDVLIVSAFIYVTGGVTSYFSFLYVFPIIAASMLQFRRGGLMAAVFSAVLYVGLVLAQYLTAWGVLAYPLLVNSSIGLPPPAVAQYTVALNLIGFFRVALLSGSLANSVRMAGVELEQASSEIADLQALNQHVIDSLQSGLATTDPNRCILTFNRAAQAITGIPFRAAVGRPIGEVLQLPAPLVAALHGDL